MLYLSPASTQPVRDAMRAGLLGQILGMNAGNVIEPGVPTTLDNGCFPDGCFPDGCFAPTWNVDKWRRVTTARTDASTLFVCCPDVPFDADRTSDAFEVHADTIAGPVAYVTQNGCTSGHVPWDRITCLFTGGDDRWKLGEDSRNLIDEARERGLWTHMGRVNTLRRLTIAARHGYDSVDGTYIARAPDTNLPKMLRYLRTAHTLAEHKRLFCG